MVSRGIDVSHWQGAVSWASLKSKHGLTWGACKATEGDSFTDDHFARNWAGIKSAGLARMAYHFARPEASSGASQAARLLSVVKPVKGDVLCLDLEESALSDSSTNAWARSFGDAIRRTGCTTVLYLPSKYAGGSAGAGLASHFDYWWFPRYTGVNSWPSSVIGTSTNTTGWARPHIWQWTASLPPGYDANVSTLTAAQLQSSNGDDDMPLSEAEWTRLAKLIDDRLTAKVADLVWSTETKLIDGAPRTYRSALASIFKDAAALEAKQGNVNVTVKWDGPTA